jgi:hypothetical protein
MKRIILLITLSFCLLQASPVVNAMGDLPDQEQDKVIYKDMLAYMENSQNDKQLLTAGTLYAMGINEPDSIGETLKPDGKKAERLILQSAELGNEKAYGILGNLLLISPTMRGLDDQNHSKAQRFLEKALEKGDYEASTGLINLYKTTQQNKKLLKLLITLDQRDDALAQYILAFIFKDGFYSENGELLVQKNMQTANYYITKACTNKNKVKTVTEFCSDPRNVEEDTNHGK